MMHLSRMAEELVLWSTEEFSFAHLPDAFTTGSSIMPQKKNPDVAELVRAKTGRVVGGLFSLFTMMKGLPLSYNRDMQEDKLPLFDAVDTMKACLGVLTEMLPRIQFDRKRMSGTASGAYATATDMAEYLVRKGMSFRDAHGVTGKVVRYCIDSNKELRELKIKELQGFSPLIRRDIYRYLTVEGSVESKRSRGGTSTKEVKKQITRLRGLLTQ
jgi:argininosuccinate lyase